MSINFSMGFSCGEDFAKKGKEVLLIDENTETRQRVGMDLEQYHEFELEFWPVEHPMEPQDEDRPVRCPMPSASSVIKESRMQEERLAESFRKRAEVPAETNREGIEVNIEPPIRAVRKRHHTLTQDDDDDHHHHHQHHQHHDTIKPLMNMTALSPPHPPLQTKKFTIFEMLQDFDKFES